MLAFLDANIVIYAVMRADPVDLEHVRKQKIAVALIDKLVRAREAVISTQVLGEFFTVITRKGRYPLSKPEALRALDSLAKFPVIDTDRTLVQAAARRSHQSQISYYGALIVEAALRSGASILYSKDMQHGMRYDTLELRNPFLG